MHLVLVGLDGNAGQRGIAFYGIGLAQKAVPGGKAVFKKRNQIYLAARFGQHVEILVVNMDISADVGCGRVLGQDIIVDKELGAFRTVLEHGAHGRVAVDIGVFALDVLLYGRRPGQLLVNVHQVRFRVANLGVLRPVENIGLGRARVIVLDERFFHYVLDFLHLTQIFLLKLLADLLGNKKQVGGRHGLAFHSLVGPGNGVENLDGIKYGNRAVALDYGGRHSKAPLLKCDSGESHGESCRDFPKCLPVSACIPCSAN